MRLEGKIEDIKDYLNKIDDINIVDIHGDTHGHYSARYGDLNSLKLWHKYIENQKI